jgi:hypothetical protein
MVAAPALDGLQQGVFNLPTVTVRPEVRPLVLVEGGAGYFSMPRVVVEVQVSAPVLDGVQFGHFDMPTVLVLPRAKSPRLRVLEANSIRAPDGRTRAFRRITGNYEFITIKRIGVI